MNLKKIEKNLIKEIKQKEETLKKIKNFYNLNYLEKYKLGVETNLIYQREDFQKELKKSFYSNHMKNGKVKINLNETFVYLDYGYIVIIPMHNNIIKIQLSENALYRKGIKFVENDISKKYIKKKKECFKNIYELETIKNKLPFYKLKQKRILNKKIIKEELKLYSLENEKEKIKKLKNKLKCSILKYENELIYKLLNEDIEFFKKNNYNIEIKLYYLNNKIVVNL